MAERQRGVGDSHLQASRAGWGLREACGHGDITDEHPEVTREVTHVQDNQVFSFL